MCGLFQFSQMSSHQHYYIDLKRSDFASDDKYLEERVRRGLAAGYTFKQCYEHWLADFKQALDNASDNASEQQQSQPNDK